MCGAFDGQHFGAVLSMVCFSFKRRAHRANLASDARFAGGGTYSDRTVAPMHRTAGQQQSPHRLLHGPVVPTPGRDAQRPAANTFANVAGTGSAELRPDCATHCRRGDRPCRGSSRVPTGSKHQQRWARLGIAPQVHINHERPCLFWRGDEVVEEDLWAQVTNLHCRPPPFAWPLQCCQTRGSAGQKSPSTSA